MLLSVLIPVYKKHPEALIGELLQQASSEGIELEIIIHDDSADEAASQWHEAYCQVPQLRIEKASENRGRSKSRNLLMDLARGKFLLFLDGDMEIGPNFLKTYQQQLHPERLLCGGISTSHADGGLRARYSARVEEKSASLRNKHPYRSFTAANFVIPQKFKTSVRFPEQHQGYGHEDTHFGLQLLDLKINIQHLDNPALHQGLDADPVFIAKSREAVHNLVKMYRNEPLFDKYSSEVKLIRAWLLLRPLGVLFFIYPFVKLFESRLQRPEASLRWLSLYKLALFERYFRQGVA
ncbi:MAG: glycosyltransferase family 2 protein [Bacteroidia bacterium]